MISRRRFLQLGLVVGAGVVGGPFWRWLSSQADTRTFVRNLMGTKVEVVILGLPADQAEEAARSAFWALGEVEKKMTVFDPASDLSRLSARAGSGPLPVDRDLREVLNGAETLRGLSRGAFTPAIGPLSRIWNPGRRRIPDPAVVEEARATVADSGLRFSADGGVELTAGTLLDLGGIAKGYGVDQAVSALRHAGVERAIVNAGGDLRLLGGGPSGDWRVGIPDPDRPERVMAVLPLRDAAVATSGDYQRYFEVDGVRYHHLIDPRTGYPGRLTRSFTAVLPEGTAADGVATAGFLLGPEGGLELVRRLGGEALAVDPEGRRWKTSELPLLET